MGEGKTLRTAKSLHRAEYSLYQRTFRREKLQVCMWCLKGDFAEGRSQGSWLGGGGRNLPIKSGLTHLHFHDESQVWKVLPKQGREIRSLFTCAFETN
jgi:hypothetical protein